ncbi:MAG: hypothetical protein ACFCUJ_10995 [Thiotrichales bacterium]
MSEKAFKLRSRHVYAAPANAVASSEIEWLGGDGWEPFELNSETAGFLIFVYAILACQHLYLRTNCAERGLELATAEGGIEVVTDENWNLVSLRVDFSAKLSRGVATANDIDHIVGRMKQCPVSRNVREPASSVTTLRLT